MPQVRALPALGLSICPTCGPPTSHGRSTGQRPRSRPRCRRSWSSTTTRTSPAPSWTCWLLHGYQRARAESGEQALELLRRAASTWCCSTCACPASTASRPACGSASAHGPSLPVIMLTAFGDPTLGARGLRGGRRRLPAEAGGHARSSSSRCGPSCASSRCTTRCDAQPRGGPGPRPRPGAAARDRPRLVADRGARRSSTAW